LAKAGFTIISQRDRHVKFVGYGDDEVRTVIVPHHREIPIGVLRSILRQAELTPNELEKL